MRERLEDIWWFIEDHLNVILTVALVVIAIVIGAYMVNTSGGDSTEVKPNTPEELRSLEEESLKLQEQFSELEFAPQSINDKNLVYKISLFMKQPFMSEDEINDAMYNYVKALKMKYNDSTNDTYLTGVKFELYDRKAIFDEGLAPRATVYYMLNDIDLDEVKKDKYVQNENVTELTWNATIEQEKEPDYTDYQLVTMGFTPLDSESTVKPLTDEEFAFYLKLNKYNALAGSVLGGAQLYLQWDLGQNVYKDGVGAILKEFTSFTERQTELGGLDDYYDNVDILKRELAIDRPQFLLFAETTEVVDSREEAQKKLIEFNPDLYTDTIKEAIEEKANELEEGTN